RCGAAGPRRGRVGGGLLSRRRTASRTRRGHCEWSNRSPLPELAFRSYFASVAVVPVGGYDDRSCIYDLGHIWLGLAIGKATNAAEPDVRQGNRRPAVKCTTVGRKREAKGVRNVTVLRWKQQG